MGDCGASGVEMISLGIGWFLICEGLSDQRGSTVITRYSRARYGTWAFQAREWTRGSIGTKARDGPHEPNTAYAILTPSRSTKPSASGYLARMALPDLVSTFLRRCVAAGLQRRCNAPAQAGRDGIPNTKGSFIMAIDSDKLNEF